VKITLPPWAFVSVVFTMLLATSGPSIMYLVSQHFIGNNKRRTLMLIPAMMLIGTGLAVNNAKAVFEALFRKETPFHRTPKKGQKQTASYRPIRDITCLLEILVGIYCLISFYIFFGYTNFVVSPFIVLYASGFLFVGIISIFHFRKPELIDLKINSPQPEQLPA
jgi:hypothetical protein